MIVPKILDWGPAVGAVAAAWKEDWDPPQGQGPGPPPPRRGPEGARGPRAAGTRPRRRPFGAATIRVLRVAPPAITTGGVGEAGARKQGKVLLRILLD